MVLRGALTIIILKFQNAIVHRRLVRSRTLYHDILRMRALENIGYIICPSRDRFATMGMISRKMKLSSDRLMPKLNNYLDPQFSRYSNKLDSDPGFPRCSNKLDSDPDREGQRTLLYFKWTDDRVLR